MIEKFKKFLAGKPYEMDESEQETWAHRVVVDLLRILHESYDPGLPDVWTRNGAYYEKARLYLAGEPEFKKSYVEADDVLYALKLVSAFLKEEKRKSGLGKTTKKVRGSGGNGAAALPGNGGLPCPPNVEVLSEGAIKAMHISKRERNPELRRACIEYYMTVHGGRIACAACGMTFGEMYGEVGEGYIEVHHLSPISQIEGVHEVDPKTDLVPLCANCHAMIHRLMSAEKKATGAELEGVAALAKLRGIIDGGHGVTALPDGGGNIA